MEIDDITYKIRAAIFEVQKESDWFSHGRTQTKQERPVLAWIVGLAAAGG